MVGGITNFSGTPALPDSVWRQGQFFWQMNAHTHQFFNNGVPDELRPVSIARPRQTGIQFPEEILIHRNRQQFLAWRALIRHRGSYTPLC